MLAILLCFHLLNHSRSNAAPIFAPGTPPHDASVFIRDHPSDVSAVRSVWDVLWSCLATTFVVTWVSVHPNVPFLEESSWSITKRRIFLMGLALLAPEVMIMWAFKQWRGAVMITDFVNRAKPEDSCTSANCRMDIGLDERINNSLSVDDKTRPFPPDGWNQACLFK